MAIDTLAKRFSMLGLAVDDMLIAPDGTIAASDRLALLDLYSGISAASGTAPTITSSSTFSIPENTTAVGTIVATGTGTIAYTITGGADQAAFALNSSSGVLTFQTAPNFEIPTDADANNIYVLQVTATGDTAPAATQTISVTVTNVAEGTSDAGEGIWHPVGKIRKPATPKATRPSVLANARVTLEVTAPPAELAISATVVKGAAWLRADDEALMSRYKGRRRLTNG